MSAIRVLIVEDHEMSRKSLAYGFNKTDWIDQVYESDDGLDAVQQAIKIKPDVILMDIGLPVKTGIEATKEIKSFCPKTKIIMLTSHNDEERALSAFKSGADGYCMKSIPFIKLLQVIEMVLGGAVWIDSEISCYILGALRASQVTSPNKNIPELTEREKEILILMSEGYTNKYISDKLCISIYTVKNHVSNIINKMAVDDRTQAALMAVKNRLV